MNEKLTTALQPFHQRLRAARGERTQRAAAERIGCPLRSYEDWEAGRRVPKFYFQRFLLAKLNGGSKRERLG